MFNVRPNAFWPWLYVKPPSDDPPGFRVAADGSVQSDVGFALPGYGSGVSAAAPADIGFGGAYRPASDGNPFGFLDRPVQNTGPALSFDGRSLPPYATSLLFPQVAEPQLLWPGMQGYGGERDAQPDTPVPGFNVKPPADDPPDFRVADERSAHHGLPNDPNLASFGYDPYADVAPPTGIDSDVAVHPVQDSSNPFGLLDRRRSNASPIPSFDGGSLPPYAISLLFPRMEEPQFLGRGLQDSSGELDAGPDELPPGFHVEAPADDLPGFHVAADGSVPDALQDSSLSSFRHHSQTDAALPIGVGSAGAIRPVEEDTYPATNLAYDPVHLPAPPRDPVQEALDQIARIYARVGDNQFNRIDRQGSDVGPTVLRGGGVGGRASPAVGDVFDPRHIVQTGGPVRPPPGPGHNGGPPLPPAPTPLSPTQTPRGAPIQGPPPAVPPPDNSAAVAGAAAAAAADTEKPNELVPVDPEANEKFESWRKIVRARGEQAPDSQYLGPGGANTAIGVRLNPRLPEPSAGRGYLPALRHLRNGYRGEFELANRIAAALPDEIVIYYGMPAGRQGPDVISLSPNGIVSVWDSKWRSGQRSISPGARAHRSEDSLDGLKWELRQQISDAVRSGRLAPDIAAMARKNVDAGNFDIYTIGTGNAHGGVAEPVRNRIRSEIQRQ